MVALGATGGGAENTLDEKAAGAGALKTLDEGVADVGALKTLLRKAAGPGAWEVDALGGGGCRVGADPGVTGIFTGTSFSSMDESSSVPRLVR